MKSCVNFLSVLLLIFASIRTLDGQEDIKSPPKEISGDSWTKLVIDCHLDPSEYVKSIEALEETLRHPDLPVSVSRDLLKQLTSLKRASRDANITNSSLRGFLVDLTDRIAKRRLARDPDDIQSQATIILLPASAQEELRSHPYLNVACAIERVCASIDANNLKSLSRSLKEASDAWHSAVKEFGNDPYLDSQSIWRARYLADEGADLDGALALLRGAAERLKPLESEPFGLAAIRAEQIHYGLFSGQKKDFVDGMHGLESILKKGNRRLFDKSASDLFILCAPAYHRMSMNSKGCAKTFAAVCKSAQEIRDGDLKEELRVRQLSMHLDFACDLGVEFKVHQEAIATEIERFLIQRTSWNQIDLATGLQVISFRMHNSQPKIAEEWVSASLKKLNDKPELNRIEANAVSLFKLLSDDWESEELKFEIAKVLFRLDEIFSRNGSASARIAGILLSSKQRPLINEDQELRLIERGFDALRQGVWPNGAVERVSLLQAAERRFERNKDPELQNIDDLLSKEHANAAVFSKALRADFESERCVEHLSVKKLP